MPALHRSLAQSLPAFSAMDDAELDDVMGRATALRIPKGSAVFEQGETATAFYVLLNGGLKVMKVTPDGQQVVIRFVIPGDIYGIAKALNRRDYPVTATALVDSVTLAWDMAIWDDFMGRHPVFARNVMQMMGQCIQEAHTRLKEMAIPGCGASRGARRAPACAPIRAQGRRGGSRRFSRHSPRDRRSLRPDLALGESGAECLGECWPCGGRPSESHRL